MRVLALVGVGLGVVYALGLLDRAGVYVCASGASTCPPRLDARLKGLAQPGVLSVSPADIGDTFLAGVQVIANRKFFETTLRPGGGFELGEEPS